MRCEAMLRSRPEALTKDGQQQHAGQDAGQPDKPNLPITQAQGPLKHRTPSARADEGQEPFEQEHQGQRREQHLQGRLRRSILID